MAGVWLVMHGRGQYKKREKVGKEINEKKNISKRYKGKIVLNLEKRDSVKYIFLEGI